MNIEAKPTFAYYGEDAPFTSILYKLDTETSGGVTGVTAGLIMDTDKVIGVEAHDVQYPEFDQVQLEWQP